MRARKGGQPRTPPSRGRLTAHALRSAGMPGIDEASPSHHNEYQARERGLGKPCFQMDVLPGHAAAGPDEKVPYGPATLQLPSDASEYIGENTSPNASLRAAPHRTWAPM